MSLLNKRKSRITARQRFIAFKSVSGKGTTLPQKSSKKMLLNGSNNVAAEMCCSITFSGVKDCR